MRRCFLLILASAALSAACNAAPAAAPAAKPTSPPVAATGAPPAQPTTASKGVSKASINLTGQTIRVIYNGSPDIKTTILDHAEGILRAWGATVQPTYGGTAQVVLGAMLNNQADVLEFSPVGALSGVNNGVKLTAFTLDEPRMDYALIGVPKIKTLQDLKGAKVGVLDTVGLNGIQVSMALRAGGMGDKDAVQIATGGQGERVAAMVSGRIDATMVGFANYLKLQSQGYNLLYSYTKEQPKMMDGVLWATPEWLAKNHEAAVAFNLALLESFQWFNDPANKDEFVKEIATLVKGADDAVSAQMYDIYKENSMFPVDSVLNKEDLAFNQQQYVAFNALPKELPVDDWADISYAQEALKLEHGAP